MTDLDADDVDGPRRYPLKPIADRIGVELGVIGGSQPGQAPAGLAALAETLGISHTMAQRLNAEGLSYGQADEYAIHLGLHPSVLWPDWWSDIEPDPDFYDTDADAIHIDGDLIILDLGGTDT